MVNVVFGSVKKTINTNSNNVKKMLSVCNNKFNTNKIKFIYINNKEQVTDNNIKTITHNCLLHCYNKQFLTEETISCANNDTTMNLLVSKSYVSNKVSVQINYLASKKDIININAYPNLYNKYYFPKGTEITANKVFISLGDDVGRGHAVFGLDNTECCLSRLKSLPDELVINSFIEIVMIEEVYDYELFNSTISAYERFLIVRSNLNSEGKQFEQSFLKRDPTCKTNGLCYRDSLLYIDRQKHIIDKNMYHRKQIAEKVTDRLKCESRFLYDYTDCYVEKLNDTTYIHRNRVISPKYELVLILGTHSTCSYFVQPLTDLSVPCGTGRRYDKFKTIDLAKKDNGYLNNENKSLKVVSNDDFLKTHYYKGYKKIDDVIQDLLYHGLIKLVCKVKPVITVSK